MARNKKYGVSQSMVNAAKAQVAAQLAPQIHSQQRAAAADRNTYNNAAANITSMYGGLSKDVIKSGRQNNQTYKQAKAAVGGDYDSASNSVAKTTAHAADATMAELERLGLTDPSLGAAVSKIQKSGAGQQAAIAGARAAALGAVDTMRKGSKASTRSYAQGLKAAGVQDVSDLNTSLANTLAGISGNISDLRGSQEGLMQSAISSLVQQKQAAETQQLTNESTAASIALKQAETKKDLQSMNSAANKTASPATNPASGTIDSVAYSLQNEGIDPDSRVGKAAMSSFRKALQTAKVNGTNAAGYKNQTSAADIYQAWLAEWSKSGHKKAYSSGVHGVGKGTYGYQGMETNGPSYGTSYKRYSSGKKDEKSLQRAMQDAIMNFRR